MFASCYLSLCLLPVVPSLFLPFVDSSAQKSFLDATFTKDHHIPLTVLPQPVILNLTNGSSSSAGPVMHKATLEAMVANRHHEHLALKVTNLQNHPVILGIDWLALHNPKINWKSGVVQFHDTFCKINCVSQCSLLPCSKHIVSTFPEVKDPHHVSIDGYAPHVPGSLVEDLYMMEICSALFNAHALLMEPPPLPLSLDRPVLPLATAVAMVTLPEMYSEFMPLFLDCPEGTLPPHHTCDHVITLEPGAVPPFGPLYNLAQKELVTLREYINDNLAKGFIQ